MQPDKPATSRARVKRYLLAGVLTAIPIWITWSVFEFLLNQLARLGRPGVQVLVKAVEPGWPTVAVWLADARLQSIVGVMVVLLALYVLGWFATRVLGRRILDLFDGLMQRIPVVKKVYGAVKQLMRVLEDKPDGVHRVVLVDFPHPDMKAVGFVMKTFREENSGRDLAAVYVPTTPNPTSGYLEIVPVGRLTETAWSMDEAMTFIVSGGVVAPSGFRFGAPAECGSATTKTDL